MAWRIWLVLFALSVGPANADDVDYQGHSMKVERNAAGRHVIAMRGARYSIPGSSAQVIGKARTCLASSGSGAGIVSIDVGAGRLLAVSRTGSRAGAGSRIIRSRWAIEADEGGLRLGITDFAEVQGDGVDETYMPLLLNDDAGWEGVFAPVLGVEQRLLDCMYR